MPTRDGVTQEWLAWDKIAVSEMACAEDDLTVEYRAMAGAPGKMWCVIKQGTILAVDARLDPVLVIAFEIAKAEGCTAWVMGGNEPKPISFSPQRPAGA